MVCVSWLLCIKTSARFSNLLLRILVHVILQKPLARSLARGRDGEATQNAFHSSRDSPLHRLASCASGNLIDAVKKGPKSGSEPRFARADDFFINSKKEEGRELGSADFLLPFHSGVAGYQWIVRQFVRVSESRLLSRLCELYFDRFSDQGAIYLSLESYPELSI